MNAFFYLQTDILLNTREEFFTSRFNEIEKNNLINSKSYLAFSDTAQMLNKKKITMPNF